MVPEAAGVSGMPVLLKVAVPQVIATLEAKAADDKAPRAARVMTIFFMLVSKMLCWSTGLGSGAHRGSDEPYLGLLQAKSNHPG